MMNKYCMEYYWYIVLTCQNLYWLTDGWTTGYTFHGDAGRVFAEFFGGDNPFAGTLVFLAHAFVNQKQTWPKYGTLCQFWKFFSELWNRNAEVIPYLIPVSELFDSYDPEIGFGGIHGRGRRKQDPPIERELYLTLEEVFKGCVKKMKISRRVRNGVVLCTLRTCSILFLLHFVFSSVFLCLMNKIAVVAVSFKP